QLPAQRPDVLFHTGYAPDIALFLRQSKEQGFRVRAYLGHGAGHSQIDKLKEGFGNEIEGFHTVDPLPAQLLDAKKLKPGVGELTAEMVKRYKAQFEPNIPDRAIAPHVSMGFNNMWILLNDVLRAPSRSTAGGHPTRSPRRRARRTSPRAAPCRGT